METKDNGSGDRSSRHHNWIEIISAILLALATVASAWSAYQATRWHGEANEQFAASQTVRLQAAEAYTKADEQIVVDATTSPTTAPPIPKGI